MTKCVAVLVADSRLLTEVIALHCFWWLEHVSRMLAHLLHFRALCARVTQGWKKRYGNQAMSWHSGLKKLALDLALVGASLLPGWDPKNDGC